MLSSHLENSVTNIAFFDELFKMAGLDKKAFQAKPLVKWGYPARQKGLPDAIATRFKADASKTKDLRSRAPNTQNALNVPQG